MSSGECNAGMGSVAFVISLYGHGGLKAIPTVFIRLNSIGSVPPTPGLQEVIAMQKPIELTGRRPSFRDPASLNKGSALQPKPKRLRFTIFEGCCLRGCSFAGTAKVRGCNAHTEIAALYNDDAKKSPSVVRILSGPPTKGGGKKTFLFSMHASWSPIRRTFIARSYIIHAERSVRHARKFNHIFPCDARGMYVPFLGSTRAG